MDAVQIFEDVFPIVSELTRLELVEVSERDGGALVLTIRLIVLEPDDEGARIRDIKEQEVYGLDLKLRDDPRLAECVAGWAMAVKHVFDQDDANGRMEVLMPHDLVMVGSLLQLKRPRTAEDFFDAALTGKQRLGRFLP